MDHHNLVTIITSTGLKAAEIIHKRADMISLDIGHENLSALEAAGHRHIVGARLRNLPPKALKARVRNVGR